MQANKIKSDKGLAQLANQTIRNNHSKEAIRRIHLEKEHHFMEETDNTFSNQFEIENKADNYEAYVHFENYPESLFIFFANGMLKP